MSIILVGDGSRSGGGIVPMHPVGRRFRDHSGLMHHGMAAAADSAVFMRFGLPQGLR